MVRVEIRRPHRAVAGPGHNPAARALRQSGHRSVVRHRHRRACACWLVHPWTGRLIWRDGRLDFAAVQSRAASTAARARLLAEQFPASYAVWT